MANLYTTTTVNKPIVDTTLVRQPDILDLLLRMDATECRAVMATLKEGNKLVDDVEVVYGKKDKPKSSGLVWVC